MFEYEAKKIVVFYSDGNNFSIENEDGIIVHVEDDWITVKEEDKYVNISVAKVDRFNVYTK